jgi:hypothetical protein
MIIVMKRLVFAVAAVSLLLPAVRVQAADEPQGQRREMRERREEFRQHHPRRAEVNERIGRQRMMLRRDLRAGKITQAQYDAEMAKLKTVKQEEISDVKAHKGHLAKEEQQGLNKELNATRKDINDMTGQAPATTPAPPANPPAGQ